MGRGGDSSNVQDRNPSYLPAKCRLCLFLSIKGASSGPRDDFTESLTLNMPPSGGWMSIVMAT